jgi:hypothetical protein
MKIDEGKELTFFIVPLLLWKKVTIPGNYINGSWGAGKTTSGSGKVDTDVHCELAKEGTGPNH